MIDTIHWQIDRYIDRFRVFSSIPFQYVLATPFKHFLLMVLDLLLDAASNLTNAINSFEHRLKKLDLTK